MESDKDDQQAPPNSTGKPAKKKSKPAPTGAFRSTVWAPLLGTLGVVCAFALLWVQLVESKNADHLALQTAVHRDFLVAHFNDRIASLRNQVRAIASTRTITDAATSEDPAAIADTSRALRDLSAFALRVDIVRPGEAALDKDAEVPISYAAIDLIRRAEDATMVGPEGASINQRGYVYMAAQIGEPGSRAGVLFAVVSPEFFLSGLATLDERIGRVRIEQLSESMDPIEIFGWGSESGAVAEEIVTLDNRTWNLVFDPGPAIVQPVTTMAELALPFGVALLLVIAGGFIATTLVAKRLRRAAMLVQTQTPEEEPAEAAVAEEAETEAETAGAEPEQAETTSLPSRGFADDAKDNFGIEVSEDVSLSEMGINLDPQIFRAYDIRGIVTENLTEDVVYWIGRAFAAEALAEDQTRAAVGRDGRHSSESLRNSLMKGMMEGGLDVADVGEVPTPLLYFATHALDVGTGVMITGSHNPPEYNGLKMMIAGVTLAEDRIQRLKERLENNELTTGEGELEEVDIVRYYIDSALDDIVVAQPLKVVVDCGNGVAGAVAPMLLEEAGCEVVPLYCDVNGDFPNHHPDPADPKNLEDLITVVQAESADLGLAFDGDGDRLGLVSPTGQIIWPDRLLMLFAQDIVSRNPGADIVYDVKCSRNLNAIIGDHGGRPIMWKTGHSHIKAKLKETGALLGGEFSGHICFNDRWYGFDDALYSAARLLEILGSEGGTVDEVFEQFPAAESTPELKIQTSEEAKFEIIEALGKSADFGAGTVTSIDGVRVDYPDGWGLIRASNTSPVLTLRFEADDAEALARIQSDFEVQIAKIDPTLKIS
ncbi:MAG: phosphomannomutase/phosphoglucomutase [Pseudomonadales bacterium]|nr:phosphomannomutase/phosphoglucomutase [Pseudomonadales bacterium]NIX07620.1 phosphomannomutase/phosphoglucomutase [Pseudomonadales bacterium]